MEDNTQPEARANVISQYITEDGTDLNLNAIHRDSKATALTTYEAVMRAFNTIDQDFTGVPPRFSEGFIKGALAKADEEMSRNGLTSVFAFSPSDALKSYITASAFDRLTGPAQDAVNNAITCQSAVTYTPDNETIEAISALTTSPPPLIAAAAQQVNAAREDHCPGR